MAGAFGVKMIKNVMRGLNTTEKYSMRFARVLDCNLCLKIKSNAQTLHPLPQS